MARRLKVRRVWVVWRAVWASVILVAAGVLSCEGVLFYSTGDPAHNSTGPGVVDGLDATIPWQSSGEFIGFLGTPISAHCFVTAKHIGGTVGQTITFAEGPNAGTYTTTAVWNHVSSDLAIWRISGTFPQFLPLHRTTNEQGKNLLVLGRGTQRGTAYLDGSSVERGWQWGTSDGVKRWGRNRVDGASGGHLIATFSSTGGVTDEAMLSVGDSGGPLFLQDGGAWKLAGVNYAVSGSYYRTTDVPSSGVQAAIYNQTGLYASANNVTFTSPVGPGLFYATRISDWLSWIDATLEACVTAGDWRQTYFGTTDPSGQAADGADPDGDGVPNLLEYAFGGDPLVASDAPRPSVSVHADRLEITFPKSRADSTYIIEASSDLITWTEISYTAVTAGESQTVSDTETLTSGSKRFLRVRVPSP